MAVLYFYLLTLDMTCIECRKCETEVIYDDNHLPPWPPSTGCPTVRVNTYTPLNFDIAQRITKPFESCHHESLRIFLVYETHWCVLLAPHKW